jgi:hypothetical protein
MPPKNGHKVERELTTSQRNQIVVDLANGAISPERVGEKYGFSGNSVRRWWKIVPEDEKMLLVAQDRQRRDVAAKRHAADMIVSDGDDIDNDLRWLIRRLRSVIEGCTDDDKLLELAQMKEMRQTLMDLAKVRGMFTSKIDVTFDLGSSPQFIMLRQIILRVLERHLDAKMDFLDEMRALKVIDHEPRPASA